MGFPTSTGVEFLRGNQECFMTEAPKSSKAPEQRAKAEAVQWVLNPTFPEQTVTLGPTLSNEIRTHLKQLLLKNTGVFAWQPSDMVGVPHHVVEHSLNTYKNVEPVVQKKRPLGTERNKAMNEQVSELFNAGIIRKC